MIELVCSENKVVMNHILRLDTFDKFLLKVFEMDLKVTYRIYGELIEDEAKLISWAEIREDVYNVVKNKQKPKSMKFVFAFDDEIIFKIASEYHEKINGFKLNINFDGETVKVTTGVNYKEFILDKSVEKKFDDMIYSFFEKKGISVKVL